MSEKMEKKYILGQEAIESGYGLGRITSLDMMPHRVGFTPYVAGYQMDFDPTNIKPIPIEFFDYPEFRKELEDMARFANIKADINSIMEMSLNGLRKELMVERAGYEECYATKEKYRHDLEQLEEKMRNESKVLQLLNEVQNLLTKEIS